MPPVRNIQAASVHGRTQRAHDASMRPSMQGRDREGERDGEADIAEVEHRRMDGEADILQHRVEVLPFDRRRIEAGERVRRGQDEQQEGGADPALHGEHVGAQRGRQVAPEHRDQRAEEGEDQHPQQHRALMVAPGSGDLEQHRLSEWEFSQTLATEKSDWT